MNPIRPILSIALLVISIAMAHAQSKLPPLVQAVPLPYQQIEFQRDGSPLARYHYSPTLKRPFLYPILGPSGRSLTRMGHPHDPNGHSHHNSVWISHNDINGVVFWGDKGKGQIVQQKIENLTDADDEASLTILNAWIDGGTQKTLMRERRKITVRPLDKGEWLLFLDLHLETNANGDEVTFGKTPFGLVGVRMAKSIGVNDGGGTIRNSEGKVNEKEVLWKPAKWVDYSGPIRRAAEGVKIEGIALMDHPSNPNHPAVFHVRNDGWMGASLTFAGPRKLPAGKPLRLRYGLYVHAGQPSLTDLESRWAAFAKTPVENMNPTAKKTK